MKSPCPVQFAFRRHPLKMMQIIAFQASREHDRASDRRA